MPQLSDFYVNQVVRCHKLYATGSQWRVGDLGVVKEINPFRVGVLTVRCARQRYTRFVTPECIEAFEPVIFQSGDRVRIVGFGPEYWSLFGNLSRDYLSQIGVVGRIVDCRARGRVWEVSANLRWAPSDINRTWSFNAGRGIPELIPYQNDEEFNVDFWRSLWLEYTRQDTVPDPVVEPDLPEPKKTKYDADY